MRVEDGLRDNLVDCKASWMGDIEETTREIMVLGTLTDLTRRISHQIVEITVKPGLMHSLFFIAMLDVNHSIFSVHCPWSMTTTNAHSLLFCAPKLLESKLCVAESQSCEWPHLKCGQSLLKQRVRVD